MLPMNVFGVNTANLRVVTTGFAQGAAPSLEIAIPSAVFTTTTRATLELSLSHNNATFVDDGNLTFAHLGPVQSLLGDRVNNGDFTATQLWRSSNGRNVTIEIVLDGGTLNGVTETGEVIIRVPAVLGHYSVNITGTLHATGIHTLPETQLMAARPGQNVTFTPGDVREFTDVLSMNSIRISENRVGLFNEGRTIDGVTISQNRFTVRLEAPIGYRWHTDAIGGSDTIAVAAQNENAWAGTTPTLNGFEQVIGERVSNLTRNVLYVDITVPTAATQIARNININNLVLRPELGNNTMGNVNVQIATMPWGHRLADNAARPNNDTNPGGLFRVDTLHVGTRVGSGLVLELRDIDEDDFEGIPEVRTGYLNIDRRVELADLDGFVGAEFGVQTAVIEIQELSPGAWANRFGDRLEFRFEQEGVSIVGAAARAGYSNAYGLIPGSNAWRGGSLATSVTNFPATGGFEIGWTSNNSRDLGDVTISENLVTVTVPQLQGSAALHGTRTVEVTFWLSVQGGFAAANPGEDIYVTVGGPGAAGLAESNRSIAVATPVDPVSLRLAAAPVEIQTDLVGDTIANRSIPNIELTIYEPHLLTPNQTITFFLGGVGANQNLGLHMAANRQATVSGRGLVLSATTIGGGEGVQGGNTVSVTIMEVPDEDMNDGPITITLTGIQVTGTLVPGVQYYAVAVGRALAENRGSGAPGFFVGHPYLVEAISNVRNEGGAGRPAGEVVISIHDRLPGVDQEPITFRTVTGQNVGLVSMRAFAYLIGGEAVPNYPNTGDWTINGVSVAGEVVQITVNDNSPNVRVVVDGSVHAENDLARWAGPLTGVPAGQLPVFNIGGNVFLPFRAMANIFGYDVEMVTSFSIRFFS